MRVCECVCVCVCVCGGFSQHGQDMAVFFLWRDKGRVCAEGTESCVEHSSTPPLLLTHTHSLTHSHTQRRINWKVRFHSLALRPFISVEVIGERVARAVVPVSGRWRMLQVR